MNIPKKSVGKRFCSLILQFYVLHWEEIIIKIISYVGCGSTVFVFIPLTEDRTDFMYLNLRLFLFA